jgi:AAA15 family ATPase/GTPase
MKLTHVDIRNYRSIQELTIVLDPKCRILVGINESGKTNVLNALNLLEPEQMSTRADIREPGLDEVQITKAFVRFVFRFEEDESAEMFEFLKGSFLSESYSSPIVTIGEEPFTLAGLCDTREAVYVANLISGKKSWVVRNAADSQIAKNWRKVGSVCPAEFSVKRGSSETVFPKKYALVDADEFPEIPSEYLVEPTVEDLTVSLFKLGKSTAESRHPEVLFWNYDEKNLLPARINLDKFCAQPDTCLPLKRMFELYQISDIAKEIADAKAGSANALNNVLRRVAKKTSKHFHKTWKEYESIKFSLAIDGPDLVARIEDKSNHYELAQRSDGFKRFVTFLLMVSAKDESDLLSDTLLLIDEPEIGLHPTGARYLMDELIEIARNNYVVFSTHSIFMIDSKNTARHLIVKKTNEITTADEVTDANIQDEEVIYKSLGYSIFSNLKEKNLLFEGWRDKVLFETAISRVPAELEAIKELKRLGRCFAQGVKQIKNVTPLFEAGDRKCLILSDNDSVATEHQRDYKELKGYGIWKRYDEILPGSTAVTGEDFVKEVAFEQGITDVFGSPSATRGRA